MNRSNQNDSIHLQMDQALLWLSWYSWITPYKILYSNSSIIKFKVNQLFPPNCRKTKGWYCPQHLTFSGIVEGKKFIHLKMVLVIFSISILSLLVRLAVSCDDTKFIYNGFKKTDLHFDGIAEVSSNGLLRMTNTTKFQQGHAFHQVPLRFKNNFDGSHCSFSTSFVFAIVSQYTDVSAHGLALVFSPTKERSGALPSQYLGLFNPANNGNASNHVLAVEFDTIFNIEFEDIDNNHVGIDVNGLRSVAAAPASYYAGDVGTFKNLSLFSGDPIQVWVEYDSVDMKLNVTISPVNVAKPSMPLLSSAINLSAIMYETMYVGFSSSSGSVIASHYVLGWSFRINGQAPALSLANLPLLPQRNKRKATTSLTIGLSLAAVVFALGTLSGIGFLVSRKMRFKEVVEDWEIDYMTHRFSYKDLYKATRGFREEELLGVGGFGRVYKGKLPTSNIEVAVKRVSHNSQQATREFVAEIMSIGRLRHRNLVQLLGYCRRKGEFLLVYEFLPNGSLDKLLFVEQGPTRVDWDQRFQIIKGVASALFYLHEEWEQVVVHRDIKAGNVMLDNEMNGKLGDFGLSRLYDHGSDPNTTTHIVGTMGYIAPELTSTGRATTRTDVFAFGVFVLEVACGRRPIEHRASTDSPNLIDWVRTCWRRGVLAETRDPKLGTDFVMQELELVLNLGLICSHPSPAARPSMRQVVQFLHGDLPLPKLSIAETGSLMST